MEKFDFECDFVVGTYYNEYQEQKMYEYFRLCLGINEDEFSKLVFNTGVKACEIVYPKRQYMLKTNEYWKRINYSVSEVVYFISLKAYEAIQENRKTMTKTDVLKSFELYIIGNVDFTRNWIICINKEYREKFGSIPTDIKISLKPKTPQTPTRTPKKKNNQLEINLNTI